ncbi:CS1 type fimbrial major subunit [Aeromonas dhakensis]|uniref:CS1 type fimbrial major subunit n=1 Tax=Aeromonas dhakensis TaxID=196024 RepID=UPI0039883FAC
MNLNKIGLVAGLLACSSVMADERVEHSVTVTAQIPTENFYVQPVGEWINAPQRLEYNVYSKELAPLAKQFDIKSTIGPVNAFLTSPAAIVSGANQIPLSVSVAGHVLTTTSQEIMGSADSATGKIVGLDIVADAAPSTGYAPGNYQGVVGMMFESAAPIVEPVEP